MTERIELEDVNNPTKIKDGVIQSELIDIQKINSEWHVITRMGHTLDDAKLIKAQILQDAKIVDEIRNPDFVNHIVGKLLSATKGHVSPESVMYVIKQELQKLLGEKVETPNERKNREKCNW